MFSRSSLWRCLCPLTLLLLAIHGCVIPESDDSGQSGGEEASVGTSANASTDTPGTTGAGTANVGDEFTVPLTGTTQLRELTAGDLDTLCQSILETGERNHLNDENCAADAVFSENIQTGSEGEARCAEYVMSCEGEQGEPDPFSDIDVCAQTFGAWTQGDDCNANIFDLQACLQNLLDGAIEAEQVESGIDCSAFESEEALRAARTALMATQRSFETSIGTTQCRRLIEICPGFFQMGPPMGFASSEDAESSDGERSEGN